MVYTRIHRLLKILTLIQSQPGWTVQRLAAECDVSDRTIFRDLGELEAAGIPCHLDPASNGYRVRADFFLPPVQLTPDEALSLSVMCEHIAEKQQIAFLRPAWRAMVKIQAALPESVRRELNDVLESVEVRTAAASPPDEGQDVYERMQRAIRERRVVNCRYESIDSTPAAEEFEFEPYKLFFSVRAWYVIGRHRGRDADRCLKLSRFAKAQLTQKAYAPPADFTIESYLGNAWRMMRGTPEFDVELRFDAQFTPTVTETLWHRTQQIEHHDDGSSTFRCKVAGLDEIVWWVLSMGHHCRVIAPAELASRVRELAEQTAALYR